MELPENFKSLHDTVTAALVSTTRSAAQIAAEDIGFHRSLDPAVATSLDRQNGRLLRLAERLISTAAASSDVVGPTLPDMDSIDSKWKGIVDVFDSLLEKADISLDDFTGVVKRLGPGKEQPASQKPRQTRTPNLFRPQNLPRPQLQFDHLPRNDEKVPFKPFITSKPHAVVPLNESIRKLGENKTQYQHPYEAEIRQYSFPKSVYTTADPIPYTPFEQTSATFVDTPEAVDSMLEELKDAKEIAIDLEHHDIRSYTGIVCLMQISSRNKDWIIDTLKPWRRKLQLLNEVFADPSILKVLHGAQMDIIWLQRDLGLYIVGLFDTYHAARTLGYTGGSLAFLLQKFVNFNAQKIYQTADWRIRPLPTEMFDYARSDTHFLLYIYDNMRNELIDRSDFSSDMTDKIKDVLEKSKETALQRYEHFSYDEDQGMGPYGWYKLLSKTPALFSREQFAVFRALHHWRDNVAREEDDSTNYVMPNHVLFSIARAMPNNKAALLGVAHPVSTAMRSRADELVSLISKAQADGINGPEMTDVFASTELSRSQPAQTSTNPVRSALVQSMSAVSLLPVRTSTSAFWGRAFTTSTQRTSPSPSSDIRLAIPLPQLTASVFSDPAEANGTYGAPQNATSRHDLTTRDHRPQQPDPASEIFTVKSLSGRASGTKRKVVEAGSLDQAPLSDSHQAGEQPTPVDAEADIDAEEREAKAQRRRERKLAKRLKREQEAQAGQNTQNGSATADTSTQEAPFDYANAPSVLHARADTRDVKRKEGAFNPYARAADAKGGLQRVQKERAGKSATFKS